MRVRATQDGFYGACIRDTGTVFDLEDPKHFSKNWMVEVSDDEPAAFIPPAQPVRHQTQTFIEMMAKQKPAEPPIKAQPKANPKPSGKKGTGDAEVI